MEYRVDAVDDDERELGLAYENSAQYSEINVQNPQHNTIHSVIIRFMDSSPWRR